MPVHADKTLEPSSGTAEAAYVQKAEMLSMRGQLAELKAMMVKGTSIAAVPLVVMPAADDADSSSFVLDTSPPLAPTLDATFEPDGTRRPLNLRGNGVAIGASHAVDHVGSFMLQCVQYVLATLCTMIALTIALGLCASARRAFAPANLVTAPRETCVGWRLICLGTQLCQTMVTIAHASSNMLDAARRSSGIAMAIVFVISGCFYALAPDGWTGIALTRGQAIIARTHQMVQSGWKCAMFVCMGYWLLASGDGATQGDLIAYNDMVRAHSGNEWLMLHANVASRMSEMWSNVMIMPAVHSIDELILLVEADGCDPEHAKGC